MWFKKKVKKVDELDATEKEVIEQLENRFIGLEDEWENNHAKKDFSDIKKLLSDKEVDIDLDYE